MSGRTFWVTGVVLKRYDSGERDRVVYILTKERGKIACLAKGVRRITSSRLSTLEPGNLISAFCVETKSWPILTQSKLLGNSSMLPHTLKAFRQLSEILEMLDQLFVEEEMDDHIFHLIKQLRTMVTQPSVSTRQVRQILVQLIQALGFPHPDTQPQLTITEYVSQLTEKPLRSYQFLKTKA
ncbi:DNA repair protein RecO [Candidatus Woesebacteria bacterium]|nr:DNA repair protein RecO [Candidatus Woesebacteria bacterium]